MALHTVPRVRFALMYYHHYIVVLMKQVKVLIQINCILNLVEVSALFGLTFISSTENYSNIFKLLQKFKEHN